MQWFCELFEIEMIGSCVPSCFKMHILTCRHTKYSDAYYILNMRTTFTFTFN